MREYFLVAIALQDEALAALREHLGESDLHVAGQATEEYLEWLNVQPVTFFASRQLHD